jgi:nucleotide-binding universal stress UspA family protein
MRWIVGIDLRARSRGAVQMAAWLRQHSALPPEFVAVHVVDERYRESAKVMSEVLAAGRRELDRVTADDDGSNLFHDARVVLARSVEAGLVEAASAEEVDGLILGRAAPGGAHRIVRLGSVARRILRRLPVPVLVVPPSIHAAEVGAGPIVMATDLGPASSTAAGLARRIAGNVGRELVVVHADPSRDFGRDFTGDATLFAAWSPRHTLEDVERWKRAQGVTARARLSDKGIVDGVLDAARDEDAALVVCGSRRLGTVDRIFGSSTGSDLARLSDRAVLVVPSE